MTRTPPHPTRDDPDDCWPDVVSGVDPSAIGDRIHPTSRSSDEHHWARSPAVHHNGAP